MFNIVCCRILLNAKPVFTRELKTIILRLNMCNPPPKKKKHSTDLHCKCSSDSVVFNFININLSTSISYQIIIRHLTSNKTNKTLEQRSTLFGVELLMKGKGHPRTDHEGLKGEQRYSSTLSLTSALDVGWVVNATPRALYSREKDPVPIVQEAGWVPGPVWTGEENLAPTRIRSTDRPARSESLYRLSYPGPRTYSVCNNI